MDIAVIFSLFPTETSIWMACFGRSSHSKWWSA